MLRPDSGSLRKVTIIPRGMAGGATFSLPEKDRMTYAKRWCVASIKVTFGGRIAEEIFLSDVTTGAMSDIRQATSIARRMVREWGMSDRLGFLYYGDGERPNPFGDFGGRAENSRKVGK